MKNNEKNGYILLSKEDSLILFWETLFQNFLPYSNKYIRYTKTDISPFYSFFVALSPQEKKKYLNYFNWIVGKNNSKKPCDFQYYFCLKQIYHFTNNQKDDTQFCFLETITSKIQSSYKIHFNYPDSKYTILYIYNALTHESFGKDESNVIFKNLLLFFDNNKDLLNAISASLILLKPFYDKDVNFMKILTSTSIFEYTFSDIHEFLCKYYYDTYLAFLPGFQPFLNEKSNKEPNISPVPALQKAEDLDKVEKNFVNMIYFQKKIWPKNAMLYFLFYLNH